MISLAAPVLSAAHLAATLTRLDTGGGNASVRLYSTNIPGAVGARADTPMCTVLLSKPCGAIVGATLVLSAGEAALVMSSGLPLWAELVAADGAVLHMGDVTDTDGDGFWRASGADTPPGETSPAFVAGGLLTLSAVTLT